MYRKLAVILLFVMLTNMGLAIATFAQEGGGIVGNNADYFVGDTIVENEYKLGPGDQLEANLIVGNNALAIENNLIVGPDGKIFFPKVGEINVVELTIPQAKKLMDEKIRKIYAEKYTFSLLLRQPRRVQIYLTGSEDKPLYLGEKKFVSVYGEVYRSGRFEYLPGKRFSDYISYAGGPAPRAHLSMATITRQNKKYSINGSDVIFNGNASKDMGIEPGDVINIPAQFIYFTDLGSFSSTVFTILALYNTFIK
jgi:protein involved in polysaccharide export with SLBB domain